ncbi:hypothetical protein MMC12_004737 [Toensbergia leucococca]|nr:hypothetical protein [Toensbergia leucococca]
MSNLTTTNGGNETLIINPQYCTLQTCDLSLASFTYIPNLAGNAFYLAIFALFFIGQSVLGIRFRVWGYMGAMLLGLILEVIGYAGRIMLHSNPFDNNAFLIYLICVTIAPALLTAAIYLCLARIVTVYGTHLSRFKPRTYTLIFCSCDLFSLVLQGLGGGIAATAAPGSSNALGKNIMIAGLSYQVFSLLLFTGFCAEFAWRVWAGRGNWNPRYTNLVQSRLFKAFLFGLFIAVLTITIRSIFRVIELSAGFNGALFNDQITFMILEGAMVIIACACLTCLHPALCFRGYWHEADFKFELRDLKFWARQDQGGAVFGDAEKDRGVLTDVESRVGPMAVG